jgi:hypothetical protein
MKNCKQAYTLIEIGLRLSMIEDSKKVDETLYSQLVGNLI